MPDFFKEWLVTLDEEQATEMYQWLGDEDVVTTLIEDVLESNFPDIAENL